MIDFGFAALLALIALGVGKRLLDWLGQAPNIRSMRRPWPCRSGMGAAALAVLALGELGCLNLLGLTIVLAVFTELGVLSVDQADSLALRAWARLVPKRSASMAPDLDRTLHRGWPCWQPAPRPSRR